MLLARTLTSLNMRVTPTLHHIMPIGWRLHPCYAHWLEERHIEIQRSSATKQEFRHLRSNNMKRSCRLLGCRLTTILFCRQTMPDLVIALLLCNDIITNSIWSLFASLIPQQDETLSSHINDPLFPHTLIS